MNPHQSAGFTQLLTLECALKSREDEDESGGVMHARGRRRACADGPLTFRSAAADCVGVAPKKKPSLLRPAFHPFGLSLLERS